MKKNILVVILIIAVIIIAVVSAIFLINSFAVVQPDTSTDADINVYQSEIIDSIEETGDY